MYSETMAINRQQKQWQRNGNTSATKARPHKGSNRQQTGNNSKKAAPRQQKGREPPGATGGHRGPPGATGGHWGPRGDTAAGMGGTLTCSLLPPG